MGVQKRIQRRVSPEWHIVEKNSNTKNSPLWEKAPGKLLPFSISKIRQRDVQKFTQLRVVKRFLLERKLREMSNFLWRNFGTLVSSKYMPWRVPPKRRHEEKNCKCNYKYNPWKGNYWNIIDLSLFYRLGTGVSIKNTQTHKKDPLGETTLKKLPIFVSILDTGVSKTLSCHKRIKTISYVLRFLISNNWQLLYGAS